jgi:hypothetical protein
VENNIKIKFTNNSNDTIWFYNPEPFRIVSQSDILDSVQLKKLIDAHRKTYLAPQEKWQIKLSYWSNSFKDKLNSFKKGLQNEKINIFLLYRSSRERYFSDSLLLVPDPAFIRKWKPKKV